MLLNSKDIILNYRVVLCFLGINTRMHTIGYIRNIGAALKLLTDAVVEQLVHSLVTPILIIATCY